MSMPATLALQIVVMFMLVGVGFAMFRAGKITMEGKASDLLHDEKVRKAYLGA